MNLLQISLTNLCNKSCSYCPTEKWRNNPQYPNLLNNERLMPFLEQLNPKEWAIELTGGEPALYIELDELLEWLQEKGFKGLVKTNGSLPIRKVPNFKIVAAFHDLDNPPECYDEILIIEYTPGFLEKIERCLREDVVYRVIQKDTNYRLQKIEHTNIERIMFINPEGCASECKAGQSRVPIEDNDIPSRATCQGCKPAIDFEKFFTEEL